MTAFYSWNRQMAGSTCCFQTEVSRRNPNHDMQTMWVWIKVLTYRNKGKCNNFTVSIFSSSSGVMLVSIQRRGFTYLLSWFNKKVKISLLQAVEVLGLRKVEAPTLLRQTANRWRQGCQPYAPVALYPQVICKKLPKITPIIIFLLK
jgi:hypothetical protein